MSITPEQFICLYPTVAGTSKIDGFPGHHICVIDASFHLHHHILSQNRRRFRVSTVGWFFDRKSHTLIPDFFEPKNLDKQFETMVFEEDDTGGLLTSLPLVTKHWPDSVQAQQGHLELVTAYEGFRAYVYKVGLKNPTEEVIRTEIVTVEALSEDDADDKVYDSVSREWGAEWFAMYGQGPDYEILEELT